MIELCRQAFKALWRKRFRTLMTMSGIVVGVALVSLVSVIGAAGKAAVNDELENMGLGGLSVTASGSATLEKTTLEALRALDTITSAVPLMIDMTAADAPDGRSQSLMLCGIDSGETQAIGLELCHGRLLSPSDVAGTARVCVVDTAVAQALRARRNIVGTTVTLPLGGVEETFTVVGVTTAGSTLMQNVAQWIPGMVYIPYTTMQQLTGRTTFDQFAVKLAEDADAAVQAAHIETVLGSGYEAQDLSTQRDKLSGILDIVTVILTAISAVALLVAGLSIMTIMTVAVSERVREIGIKKALGATRRRIRQEFLVEALLLSLIGGVVGVVLGGGGGMAVLALFGVTVAPPALLAWLILFAAVLGTAFGVYPAMKAARLDPVVALTEQ